MFETNLILRKIFLGNPNEVISLAEIALFRFPRKVFLKRELTISVHKKITHSYMVDKSYYTKNEVFH